MSTPIVNGWTLFAHEYFEERLSGLIAQVEQLTESDPDNFIDHPAYKLFEKVNDAIMSRVPQAPSHKDFRIGQLLGRSTAHWRRVKHGLPQRYRLFFQFRTSTPKTIIYCWLNDQNTYRKEGSRTDVYTVFAQMISSGKMPNSFEELRKAAKSLPQTG